MVRRFVGLIGMAVAVFGLSCFSLHFQDVSLDNPQAPASPTSNVILHVPKPPASPHAPEDWPDPITYRGKLGELKSYDKQSYYRRSYIVGWEEQLREYAPLSELDLSFPCITGWQRQANRDGARDCKQKLRKLEAIFGKERLVEFLRIKECEETGSDWNWYKTRVPLRLSIPNHECGHPRS